MKNRPCNAFYNTCVRHVMHFIKVASSGSTKAKANFELADVNDELERGLPIVRRGKRKKQVSSVNGNGNLRE